MNLTVQITQKIVENTTRAPDYFMFWAYGVIGSICICSALIVETPEAFGLVGYLVGEIKKGVIKLFKWVI